MAKWVEQRNKTFRISVPLLLRLEKKAADEEVSLNQLIERLLLAAVPERDPLERMLANVRRAEARRGGSAPREQHFTKDQLHEDDR